MTETTKTAILINSSSPSIRVEKSDKKGRVVEYSIISNGEVVGFIHRWEEVSDWSIETSQGYCFTVGFIGRLIQLMMEYQVPA